MAPAEIQPARRWSDIKELIRDAWLDPLRKYDDPHKNMTALMECLGSALDFTQCVKIEFTVPTKQRQFNKETLQELLKVVIPKRVELKCPQDGNRTTVEISSPDQLIENFAACDYSVENLVFEISFRRQW